MAVIIEIGTALPAYVHDQSEVTEVLASQLAKSDSARAVLSRIHEATKIEQRHFVMPIQDYVSVDSFSKSNGLFTEHALALAAQATQSALSKAGLEAKQVDYLFFTTVTGVGAPSLDVLLASQLGFRSDLKRIPSFGLGCAGGAAGIARVADYLRGHPTEIALVVSVELCSLTIQWQDRSMANFVGTGIFGDGAATVVMVGEDHPLASNGIGVSASRSILYPDTEQMIGWQIGTSGMSLMLEAGVPEIIGQNFARDVDAFLAASGSSRAEVDVWVAHPGGPKILDGFTSALGLENDELSASWGVMKRAGNMSSAAVLHVLSEMFTQPSKSKGLLFALGPGVTVELVLLEWS
ncbi:type III polyketide synthase [Candidatus Aquiluna sp. UB-MaderosW2red]|uniref:type III polyketide synthase n=1 Tax=Candidatus Aquiluna sp. UB-MaderosW2red TaxID=1855377 RepID=UPI000875B30F|nr:3-oxoacyl-[acyl-carrier-protein] synthase III C-terminal domain-containing protein [Candidatus Aquiluna sp. UB-MaderosW2red]SCX10793.1 alkylresorcinol/alkylpyrone synthase [Candidatus Aquiluna sp. UB-MaderosW2red]